MSDNHSVSKLDDLIITLIDSVKGYEHSADKAEAARFANFFTEMAAERRTIVDALRAQSSSLGGTPADYGSAAATLHRGIESLRVALGGGDKAILAEIERGEAYLKEEYDRACADDGISAPTKAVIAACYASVARGNARADALRDELAAS